MHFVYFLIALIPLAFGADENQALNNIFNNYDARQKPTGNKPIDVKVNMFLRSVVEIDSDSQIYKIDLTFRQEWHDSRLSYNNGPDFINLNHKYEIWKPDTFFGNELKGDRHSLTKENFLTRILPNGDVLSSERVSLKLACPMNLRQFPFDIQKCPLGLASYGHTDKEVVYSWKYANPIQTNVTSDLQEKFKYLDYELSTTSQRTTSGQYASLRVEFKFKRQPNKYLVQAYIPTLNLVLTSFLTFFFSPKKTSRLVLILVVFALTCKVCSDISYQLRPSVPYTTRLDCWTGVCMTFVWAALVQTAIVQYLANRQEDEDQLPLNGKEPLIDASRRMMWVRKCPAKKIDVWCRIVFPVLFVVFNIIYWPMTCWV